MNRFILLIGFAVLVAFPGCNRNPGLSSFDTQVNVLIHEKCNFDGPCEITIGEATDFDWDEMYIFRPGIVDGEPRKVVPAAKGFRGEFNRQIAFLKDGRLVKLDEAASITEGEHTPSGMLFFNEGVPNDCLRYPRDAVFKINREKWTRGVVYKLACTNCTTSPVFAESGSLSR